MNIKTTKINRCLDPKKKSISKAFVYLSRLVLVIGMPFFGAHQGGIPRRKAKVIDGLADFDGSFPW